MSANLVLVLRFMAIRCLALLINMKNRITTHCLRLLLKRSSHQGTLQGPAPDGIYLRKVIALRGQSSNNTCMR